MSTWGSRASVTRYEFTLDQGVKLSKITNLSDDIALALGASGVRIAPVPNKISAVGIEVPNKTVTAVRIRDVIESREFTQHPSTVAFAVGKDIGGKPTFTDLAKMPHLLVAGTTGSGKSVAINTMILSLLYRLTPEQVRFIMIDPKMLELSVYNGIPHLLTPVVTDPKKAVLALNWAVRGMDNDFHKAFRFWSRLTVYACTYKSHVLCRRLCNLLNISSHFLYFLLKFYNIKIRKPKSQYRPACNLNWGDFWGFASPRGFAALC